MSTTAVSLAPVELVRARLESLGRRIDADRGDRFTAQCPAHEDRTPSLSVKTGTEIPGCAVLYCHAGCEFVAIVEALSLDPHDLFPVNTRYKECSLNVSPHPYPCNAQSAKQTPDLLALLYDYERGDIEPVPVQLGKLRSRANEDDRRVAEDLRLLFGLRFADGDLRPLPYSARFCAERMGWPGGEMRANRVLRRLSNWDVIERAGELQRRPGMARGTMTYRPGFSGVEVIERQSQPVEVDLQPAPEVANEPRVNRAQAGSGEDARMVTSGDGTLSWNGSVPGASDPPVDLVQDLNDTPKRGAVWVREGVMGHVVWPTAERHAGTDVMPF